MRKSLPDIGSRLARIARNAAATRGAGRVVSSCPTVFAMALFFATGIFHPSQAVHAASAESRPASSIEVTAEAEVDVAPNLAVLDFGVVTQAPTAAAAAGQNSERMEAVLAAVRKALGANARITTGTYTLRGNYTTPRDGSAPRIAGYTATNVIQLKSSELARLGDVIDIAVQAGANQVQRIAFTLSDPAAPHRDALREAVLKARAEAEVIATALGLRISAFHSIVAQDMGQVRPLLRSAMVAQAESAPVTPVEPGLIQVRARVVLTMLVERR